MPTLSHIAVYPIKALDPAVTNQVSVTEVGGLAGDRVYGIVDGDGEYVHGKRTPDVHRLDATFDLAVGRVTLGVHGTDRRQEFQIDRDRHDMEAWLSEYFGVGVEVVERSGGAQTDSAVYTDSAAMGPTVVSEATLEEVASWYDGIGPDEMCRRLRPNLLVEGVPAFWEERLLGDGELRVGEVTLEGVMPVPRCVVPTRHPDTGETDEGFRETFVSGRAETMPAWTDREALDGNLFSLTVVTRIPAEDRDGELRVGDPVRLDGGDGSGSEDFEKFY